MTIPAPRSVVLIALLLATHAVFAADLRGIYVYTNDVSLLSKPVVNGITSALGVPGMDGIVIVIGWNAIEPAAGQFQWDVLDQWMHLATSLGKKIDLDVTAGSDTPSWLFTAGAKPLAFTISPHSGATGKCDSETIAAPWDSVFLNRWAEMLAALAAHLKSSGTYSSVTLVKLTGINRTTDEFRLPAETAQSTGLSCVSDAIAIWQQAGYAPSRLLAAWDSITTAFQSNFPDKTFSVAIIPKNAFPAIAEDGSQIKGTPPDANLPLLTLASQKMRGRLVVQFDFLMPGEAASSAVTDAAKNLGTLAAFQTNEYLGSTGQGAACSEPVTNPTPCTTQTFMTMLETGIYPLGISDTLRAQYIEVFQSNANAFQVDILLAHDELEPTTHRHVARH